MEKEYEKEKIKIFDKIAVVKYFPFPVIKSLQICYLQFTANNPHKFSRNASHSPRIEQGLKHYSNENWYRTNKIGKRKHRKQ